ncbi:phage tail protein [Intestinimonas butyriciproducens]|uniref:phage tail protein n=1 Tax=Intestinimonas TaxID=1392389 RepID=UPI000E4DF4BC|nr:phage tail protein [Intestinimonas butyriciproducens]MBU5432388.1 phage tail protein [Intestinimonas sp. MSJ-38]RHO56439.1 phage tail protein [Ruminococcaceae bacterium AM07-15]RHT69850.1 phage tail protein [Ruminococcaceae bacterium AM28-23LB]
MLPYRNFRFRLEIDGLDAGSFSEVSGFDATIDVVEYRAGDDPAITPTKLPGLIKYGNITLKWGSSETMVLYDWLIDITEGTIEKKTVTLTALDEEGSPAASWRCINAWPVKYTAPDFNGTSSEVAIETIELAHEGLTRTE